MNKSSQLVIIKSSKKHFWQSCQVIEEHILKAIESSEIDRNVLEVDEAFSQEQLDWLGKLNSIDINLFFLSDVLNYQNLCESLLKLQLKNLRFYFPIYGNMTMEIYRWLSLDKLLQGQKVMLLGASLRSCQQIAVLTKNEASIKCLPFCFESPKFTLNKTDKLTIDLVYAGRITPQKNIFELMDCFTEAFMFNPNLRLHIAGDFHERAYHLHGYAVDIDSYKTDFHQRLNHPGIIYHGVLGQEKLLSLYQDSDYFISMSTYHDEDFGMSACQASSLGLGFILSDWGGHSSYKSNSTFIPVEVDSFSVPKISGLALLKTLVGLKNNISIESDLYNHSFNYKTFISRLEALLTISPLPFDGVSELYFEYADLGIKSFPFFNPHEDTEKRKFYMRIYQAYLADQPESERLYRL